MAEVALIATTLLTALLAALTWWYARSTRLLLRHAEIERDDRRDRELSEQARLVGGYIRLLSVNRHQGLCILDVHVVNASLLPVRGVVVTVRWGSDPVFVHEFPVVEPGNVKCMAEAPAEAERDMRLLLDFYDDNGVRWRKYWTIEEPLIRLTD